MLADLRKEYQRATLDPAEVHADPMGQFQRWFDEALAAQLPEPNAMHLATVTPDGHPTGRVVLLKGLDARGFVFYTNYQSQKGQQLRHHPYAALTFFWAELERQVRVEGPVAVLPAAESDAYFASRPLASQIGAWVSAQSEVIESRTPLEARERALTAQYAGQAVPRPPHWGGFRLTPDRVEFWQGRPSRLHDRVRYQADADRHWHLVRLSP